MESVVCVLDTLSQRCHVEIQMEMKRAAAYALWNSMERSGLKILIREA